MKSIVLSLLLFLGGSIPAAVAQTVFAPPGSVWHFDIIPDMDPPLQNYIKYATEKDTLFEGKNCSKIVGLKVQVNSSGTGYDTISMPTQYTYTSGDTVFYYIHDYKLFQPLYIFNVAVNDTVTYHMPYKFAGYPDSTFRIVIDSIKTIVIDGQPLRRIWSSPVTVPYPSFAMEVMTERLGLETATALTGYSAPYKLYYGGLRCYKDTQIDTNVSPWHYGCEQLQPVSISEQERPALSLFPNPASDKVLISGMAAGVEYRLRVYDVSGREFSVVPLRSGNGISIDVSALPGGVYALRLLGGDGSSYGSLKLLKQ